MKYPPGIYVAASVLAAFFLTCLCAVVLLVVGVLA